MRHPILIDHCQPHPLRASGIRRLGILTRSELLAHTIDPPGLMPRPRRRLAVGVNKLSVARRRRIRRTNDIVMHGAPRGRCRRPFGIRIRACFVPGARLLGPRGGPTAGAGAAARRFVCSMRLLRRCRWLGQSRSVGGIARAVVLVDSGRIVDHAVADVRSARRIVVIRLAIGCDRADRQLPGQRAAAEPSQTTHLTALSIHGIRSYCLRSGPP